jgi:hypothetical protein
MTGIERIAAERKRQIEEEGWTEEHDDRLIYGQLANAAASYAITEYKGSRFVRREGLWVEPINLFIWPFDKDKRKPVPDNRIRELEKAGALIAAEIDRLLRLEENTSKIDVQDFLESGSILPDPGENIFDGFGSHGDIRGAKT